jgi:hypothetical protein
LNKSEHLTLLHYSADLHADPFGMYLRGPGGTRKSRVIDALKDFFEVRGKKKRRF